MGFNKDQELAIYTPGNIIVSAGAGSGKTSVMIARIIEKLKSGVSLDEMLIVTFTRASAADMRIKLTEQLLKMAKKEELRDIADAALDVLPTCNIGTLDSYCQKLVRLYFYAAELEPSALLCDEGEAEVMKKRAAADAVESAWNDAKDPYFMSMYDVLCTQRNDDSVKKVIFNILEFALTMPDPDGYLDTVHPDKDFFAGLDDRINPRRKELLYEVEELKDKLAEAGMTKHAKKAEELEEYLKGCGQKVDLRGLNKKIDPILHDELAELRDRCAVLVGLATEIKDAQEKVDSELYSKALLDVAADAYDRYKKRKKALGKIDFSDLELGAYRVLDKPACMSEIRESVKYVFIDEFQDVNPLQSAIAETFRAAGAEMFVVGDIKQSIYGFRRCSPEHFKRAVKNAKALGEAKADGEYTHIPLTYNYRSTEAVIKFVNKVFKGVMTNDFGGVDYSDDAQRLKPGNDKMVGGRTAFYLVGDEVAEKPPVDSISEPSAEPMSFTGYSIVNNADGMSAEHNEAVLVADCIVDYIKKGVKKKGASGRAKPALGSIAVLVRSTKNSKFCAALTAELGKRNIAYKLGNDVEADTFPEIVALIDILRCADNRLDDIALYTAMRSGMGGFSDEQLADIAEQGKKACIDNGLIPLRGGKKKKYALWQKIEAYQGELKDKVDKFVAARDRVVEFAHTHDCADVLGFITSEFDYFQHVYETNGSAAATVDSLIRFAADRGLDMHAFIEYYDNSTIKLPSGGGGDAVTITTIHKSKGLEYDCVIVADTAKKFNEMDRSQRVLISEKGVFVKRPLGNTGKLIPSAPWLAENLECKSRERAEELRLLYVALTRAKYTLIVTGLAKEFKKVEPCDSDRMLKFLRKLEPNKDKVPRLPLGDPDADYPFDEQVAQAVAARHKQAEQYNVERLKCALPVKTCVTAVAHREWEGGEDYTSTSPVLTVDDTDRSGEAAEKKSADGSGGMLLGTAYHSAMELLDFDNPDKKKLDGIFEKYKITDKKTIEKAEKEILTALSVMSKLAENRTVTKERYFIVNLPAAQVYGDESKSGDVLVQGVIDLLIVDNDGAATIIDYKTGNPASLLNDGYKKQLELYSAAVERCTPFKVKRAALYSFSAGKVIDL